jgi:dihydrofolate reductase
MRKSLIVARARNGTIGRDNTMPWHLPADLAHFKRTTLGHPVIMGRRTWESLGRPRPGRRKIVVSRTPGYVAPGAEVTGSLAEAWRLVADAEEAFVIGGGELYAQAMPEVDRIYLTDVAGQAEGDAFFPEPAAGEWHQSVLSEHPADERHRFALRFLLLERRPPAGGR